MSTQDTARELEPCPFCRSNKLDVEESDEFEATRRFCCDCGTCGPFVDGIGKKERAEADRLWNTRAALAAIGPDELRAENARLREALEPFADGVFNDNGDLTVRRCFDADDVTNAYFAYRKEQPRQCTSPAKPSRATVMIDLFARLTCWLFHHRYRWPNGMHSWYWRCLDCGRSGGYSDD